MVFRRKRRSCLNLPAAASELTSAFVAARTRTFTRRVVEEPTRSRSPVSRTRRSFACKFKGTLAISSRNNVLPSASSNRPTRSTRASVNAPFTCPKSSLSKTPSESPAQVDLRSQDGEQAVVFPGLGDEIAGAATHGLDRQFDAAPSGHDHHGHGAVEHLDAREQVESFLA